MGGHRWHAPQGRPLTSALTKTSCGRSSRTACAHETRRDAGAFNEEVVTGAFCLTDHASRRSRRRVVAHNVGRRDRARMGTREAGTCRRMSVRRVAGIGTFSVRR